MGDYCYVPHVTKCTHAHIAQVGEKMPNGSCFVVLFAGVLCLFAVHSAEGQAGNCNLTGGYDINTLTK